MTCQFKKIDCILFLVGGFSYHITYHSADTHLHSADTLTLSKHTLTLNTMENSDFTPVYPPLDVIPAGDPRTEENRRQLDAHTPTPEVLDRLHELQLLTEQIVNSSEFAERQNPSMDEQAAFYAEDDENNNDENNNDENEKDDENENDDDDENENERLRREAEKERNRLYKRAYDDAMYDRFIGLEPTRPSYLPENEPLITESEQQRMRDEEER